MPDNSAMDASVKAPLQEALKSLRPIMRRALDLSEHDVSAVIVEPVLTALGWDVRDPRQTRRPGENASLKLLSSGKTVMTIRAGSSLEPVPEAISASEEDSGEWIVVTNGASWNIFNQRHLSQPFRAISLSDAASQKEAVPVLAMLAREAFQKDGLTEAWMSEAVDRDIERILARHLDGSPALVEAIKSGLSEQGIQIGDTEIRAALSRIDISLGNTPLEESGPAETPAISTTTATTRSPAKAKRGPGRPRKSESKPAEKEASTKRGPGRPRKSETKPVEASTPAKRGPGRPRKSEAKPVEAATPAKRGPGRPRKSEAAPKVAAESATAGDVTKSAKASTKKTAAKSSAKKTSAATSSKVTRGAASKKAQSTAPAAKASDTKVTLPASPEDIGWPKEATHAMKRKKNIVFMKYNAKTEATTILPKSLIVESLGKALNPQMIEAREKAVSSEDVVPYGEGMLEVKKPIEFHSPRAAASFAAGTLVKDLAALKDKKGVTLKEKISAPTPSTEGEAVPAPEQQPAESETETA